MPFAKHDESDTIQVAKEEEKEEKEGSSGASVSSSSQVLAID